MYHTKDWLETIWIHRIETGLDEDITNQEYRRDNNVLFFSSSISATRTWISVNDVLVESQDVFFPIVSSMLMSDGATYSSFFRISDEQWASADRLLNKGSVSYLQETPQVKTPPSDPVGSDEIRYYPTVGSDGIPIVGKPVMSFHFRRFSTTVIVGFR